MGLGTRTSMQYPFALYNHAVLRHKTNDDVDITHFHLLIRLQLAKRPDHFLVCN